MIHTRRLQHRRRCLAVGAVLSLAFAITAVGGGSAAGADGGPVGLGTATDFAVLAGSTVTNTGPSVITGDVGVSPGTAITGFPPATVTGGTIHSADGASDQAQADLTVAYDDAASRATSATVTADLGGQSLAPGVYTGPTLSLTGQLTLDAGGNADAVFVFQAGSTLTTASASSVLLINGASACNVVWQVGSSATLGTDSGIVGTVMALTSITATTNATVSGRLLARNGAVTLDTNTITRPSCAVVPPTTTSPPTTTEPDSTTTTGGATTLPPTTVPPTTAPPTTVPGTTAPPTTVPGTTVPATTVPATTVPATTTPATTVPATTTPATTAPPTTVPATTVPATTAPENTVPPTTIPVSNTIPGTPTTTVRGSESTTTLPLTSQTLGRGTTTTAGTGRDTPGGSTTTAPGSTTTSGTPGITTSELARTGSNTGRTVRLALGFLLLGGVLVLGSRRLSTD